MKRCTALYPDRIPADRFWRFVRKTPTCWVWTGGLHPQGYGMFSITKSWELLAHRAAYALCVGRVVAGKVVMHLCDRKDCCNPEHLRLGTDAENVRDAYRRGQIVRPRGPEHHMAKLSWSQVHEIRSRWAGGERHQRIIALAYGVSQRAISLIIRGETYVKA